MSKPTRPPAPTSRPPAPDKSAAKESAAKESAAKESAAKESAAKDPSLHRGQLVSYVVVDDAGNEHTATALVVDTFVVDEVIEKVDDAGVVHRVEVHTAHAQVAYLPAPLAIGVDALTPLT